jgi:threonine synthase
MEYVSTRGGPKAGFAEVLLGGPAPDGGLFLPQHWPQFSQSTIRDFAALSYAETAFRVMRPFIGDVFTHDEFRADVEAAYVSFSHPAVAPLVQFAPNVFLLELFHGPTLAFKDIAMQLMARLFARALAKQNRRATIIVATSGDTGAAATAAFRGQPQLDVVVLHPKGRVSDIQRRQMTTALDANVHNIALEGTFDDTQAIVKALFADTGFARRSNLTAVNSINLVRILAQSVYYFTAGSSLGAGHGRSVNFVVPTGNFGDVFAGEAAARMGLSIARLGIATNVNDILVTALKTGAYSAGHAQQTLSPSMDIQIASNFERAMFEASDRDSAWMAGLMREFGESHCLNLPPRVLAALQSRYLAARTDDKATIATIARIESETGLIVDPHTAVGVATAEALRSQFDGPVVALATAHPAKFPEAITRAINRPSMFPPRLGDLLTREERYIVLPNAISAVKEFILGHVKTR